VQFTPDQAATFKAWLDANAVGLSDQDAAALANTPTGQGWSGQPPLAANPWLMWRITVPVNEIYNTQDSGGNYWSWTNYQQQSAVQQDAWKQMFIVGQQASMALQNLRSGIQSIFGNTGAGLAQKTHCYAIGQIAATNCERLYATAVQNPVANTGNDGIPGNRGNTTNPDNYGTGADGLPMQGHVTAQQVAEIRG